MTDDVGLADALAKVQAKLTAVAKDKKANAGQFSYTYADLAAVQSAALPLMAAEGLAWIARPTVHDGAFVLAYSLVHGPSGEREDGYYPLPDPTRGTAQQAGSAITYARRYCLSAVVGVATEDDDGAAASHDTAPRPQRKKAERGPVPTAQDPWADVSVAKPPVVTDEAWKAGVTQRVAGCDNLPELRGLRSEVVAQVKAQKASEADGGELLTLIDEHGADLKARHEAQQAADALGGAV